MPEQKIIRQIKERIKQSLKNDTLEQLELDSLSIRQITKDIKNLIESYPSIEYLTLNDCQLISLNNFPVLPNLAILQLSNNKIYDDELFHLLKNTQLTHLMIDENRLKSIEKVSVLRHLGNLDQLQISNNLMGDSNFYREELFDRIPNLKIIDCKDKYGNIAIDSEDESEDEDNSMITLGKRAGESKLSRKKSSEIGNIGDQGQKQLLLLLGEDNILSSEEQQGQSLEQKNGNKMQSSRTSQLLRTPQRMQQEQEQMEGKCRKILKKMETSNSKLCSIQYSKTEVVDDYDDDDDYGAVQ